jgi:hypothetical protein
MNKEYSIAEIYKLIQDNPNNCEYLQLLEEKKQKIIRQNKSKNKRKNKKTCLYEDNTETILDCHCLECQAQINKYRYNQKAFVLILKNLINKASKTKGRENKIEIVKRIFENVLLTDEGKILLNNNQNFKQVVKEKLIYFYNEDKLFYSYNWYRRIFNERIPIINKD